MEFWHGKVTLPDRTWTNCANIVFPPAGSKISSVRCGEGHCLPGDVCGSFCKSECTHFVRLDFLPGLESGAFRAFR